MHGQVNNFVLVPCIYFTHFCNMFRLIFRASLTLIIACLYYSALHSQNLLVNGDFDNITGCPDDHGQFDLVVGWSSPSRGSTDLYNRCAGAGPCTVCVPNYLWFGGFQEPRSGDGFAGMFMNFGRFSTYREYMRSRLLTPLEAGRSYTFTMYINLSDGSEFAASAPQIHFSADDYTGSTNSGFFNQDPQIDFDTIITDRDNWVQLTTCYTASGGERFITIGNFRDANETELEFLGNNEEPHPYYLIDDVSLIPMDSMAQLFPDDTVRACAGEQVEITLPPGSVYTWSDGSNENPRIFTRSGKFRVETPGPCGNTIMDSVFVWISDRLDLNIPDSIFICENGSVLLKPGGEIDSWMWQDGSTADSFLITHPGLFWVEAMNECGTVRDSVFAELVLDPVSDLPRDTTFCEGDSLWLTANSLFNPVWEGNVFSDSFLVTQGGTYVLELSNFCGIVTDIILVNAVPKPMADLGEDRFICDGDSVAIVPTVEGDMWQWNDGTQDSMKWMSQEGWYWIEAMTDCGTIRDSVFIQEGLSPPFPFGSDTSLCEGASWVISFPANLEVLWQDGNTNNTYTISQAGRYSVELISVCDTIRDTIDVDLASLPTVTLPNDTTFCSGDSLELMYNGTDLWQWSDGSMDSTFTIAMEGNYFIAVTNLCGTVRDSIQVVVDVPPLIELVDSVRLCEGDMTSIQPTSNQSEWEWMDGTNTPSFTIVSSGWISVSTSNTCGSASDSAWAVVEPLPDLSIDMLDVRLCAGDTVTLEAFSFNGTIEWPELGSTNSQVEVDRGGEYLVIATNQCGETSTEVNVQEVDCGCDVYVPNAFSPNGDNINDLLEVFAACNLNELQMDVYSRWGELIFKSTEGRPFWDGSFQGEMLAPDVFVYHISYKIGTLPFHKTGSVTLLK